MLKQTEFKQTEFLEPGVTKKIRWLSTGILGVRILRVKMPGGNSNLVLFGVKPDDYAWQVACKHGFLPTRSQSMLYRPGCTFTLSEMRDIFPKAFVIEVDESATYLHINSSLVTNKQIDDSERKAAIEMQGYRLIGRNYLGQEVYEDNGGARFIVIDGKNRIREREINNSGAFLRVSDARSLELCADGFVRRIMDGEVMTSADVSKFAGAIYGEYGAMPSTDLRLRRVQEAIETSIFKTFAKTHQSTNAADFVEAMSIESRQPAMTVRAFDSVALRWYSTPLFISTPLSLSIAVQSILNGVLTPESHVLEPTIGNASLVFALNCRITGYDLDADRIASVNRMNMSIEVQQKDFLDVPLPTEDNLFDAVISNPPFGRLQTPIDIEGIHVTRLDHLVLMKSLQMRRKDGAAVFIIGGDFKSVHDDEPGKLEDSSQNLFNWLVDHYDVSAFEIDSELYAKQGIDFSVRIVVVGHRVSPEESASRQKLCSHRITKLPVVKTHDEMWHAAQAARAIFNIKANIDEQIGDIVTVNRFQVEYQPASAIGEASSVIPINLVNAQRKAFQRLKDDIGDIDEFVSRSLQISIEDLPKVFTPEQVDAIALAIWNINRGRGLILGDATGQGKGRVMAAISLYAALNNLDGIFLTEKQNLFSDFWRDIVDIGADKSIQPLLVNNDASIIDFMTGKSIYRSAPANVKKRIFDGNSTIRDEGATTMMVTYSQFNRPAEKLARANWLSSIQSNSLIMLDESHNAAGESNTGINIAAGIENAAGAIYSSATFAKDAKNFAVYSKAFPRSVNLNTLKKTLDVGGEPLMEVLSSMLVEDGVMICRQSDISNLCIESVQPDEKMRIRNRELSAAMSEILLEMFNLFREIKYLIKLYNEETEEGVKYVNFGNRLYNINRQFLLALSIDLCIARAKIALANGEKPILVIEQTMETVLRELLTKNVEDDDGNLIIDGEIPLQFRDLLYRMLDKIQIATVYDDDEKPKHIDIYALVKTKKEKVLLRSTVAKIRDMIGRFPDLSCNPIDDFSNALRAEGWRVGEISGRSLRSIRQPDGSITTIDNVKTGNRAKIVFDFNNGNLDALVITRAGSTGLSLHASDKFKDQRRRRLIEAQIANDVNVRIQFFGRVNRRGQISTPAIESVTSGLPCEVKNLSMQNQKLRKLSANTTSNRKNVAEIDDCPDILNKVGNSVCYQYLLENPEIARTLDIELTEKKNNIDIENNQYFVDKLTGYIMLLHPDIQDRVFNEIFLAYNDRMRELTMKGENPLEERIMDVKGEITESFMLSSGSGNSVFDAPVIAGKLNWTEYANPLRWEKVCDLALKNLEEIRNSSAFQQVGYEYLSHTIIRMGDDYIKIEDVPMRGFLKKLDNNFRGLMRHSLPKIYIDSCNGDLDAGIRMALDAKNDNNVIKNINSRRLWMHDNLSKLMPFHLVKLTIDGEQVSGMIVDVTLPDPGREHYPGQWDIKIAIPGEQTFRHVSMNQLMRDSNFEASNLSARMIMDIARRIDNAPRGRIAKQRWVLTGNLFAAAEIVAANIKCNNHSTYTLGHAGIFTDKTGIRHRAIICNSYVTRDHLMKCIIPISSAEEAADIMFDKILNDVGDLSFNNDFSIRWRYGEVTILTPVSKAVGECVFQNKNLIKAIGKQFVADRGYMKVEFIANQNRILAMMKAFYAAGMFVPRPSMPTKQVSDRYMHV